MIWVLLAAYVLLIGWCVLALGIRRCEVNDREHHEVVTGVVLGLSLMGLCLIGLAAF